MSNYHILEGREDGNYFTVVFHLPVPDTINPVGFNYRTAIAAQLGIDWKSAVPHVSVPEETQLLAGELYEHRWGYDTQPGTTLIGKRDELDALFIIFSSSILAQLEARFEFYGFDRDI